MILSLRLTWLYSETLIFKLNQQQGAREVTHQLRVYAILAGDPNIVPATQTWDGWQLLITAVPGGLASSLLGS